VQACVEVLNQRPATTVLMESLRNFLVPVVIIILIVTVVGLVIVPFLVAALSWARSWARSQFWNGSDCVSVALWEAGSKKPLVGFLIGSILLTLLYMVPILGALTYTIFGVWGLGCAATAVSAACAVKCRNNPRLRHRLRNTACHGGGCCSGPNANGQCASHPAGHRSRRAGGSRDGIAGRFGSG